MLILIFLIFLLPMLGRRTGFGLNVLSWLLSTPVNWLYLGILTITGTYNISVPNL
jgi:hypothetical protein